MLSAMTEPYSGFGGGGVCPESRARDLVAGMGGALRGRTFAGYNRSVARNFRGEVSVTWGGHRGPLEIEGGATCDLRRMAYLPPGRGYPSTPAPLAVPVLAT